MGCHSYRLAVQTMSWLVCSASYRLNGPRPSGRKVGLVLMGVAGKGHLRIPSHGAASDRPAMACVEDHHGLLQQLAVRQAAHCERVSVSWGLAGAHRPSRGVWWSVGRWGGGGGGGGPHAPPPPLPRPQMTQTTRSLCHLRCTVLHQQLACTKHHAAWCVVSAGCWDSQQLSGRQACMVYLGRRSGAHVVCGNTHSAGAKPARATAILGEGGKGVSTTTTTTRATPHHPCGGGGELCGVAV